MSWFSSKSFFFSSFLAHQIVYISQPICRWVHQICWVMANEIWRKVILFLYLEPFYKNLPYVIYHVFIHLLVDRRGNCKDLESESSVTTDNVPLLMISGNGLLHWWEIEVHCVKPHVFRYLFVIEASFINTSYYLIDNQKFETKSVTLKSILTHPVI